MSQINHSLERRYQEITRLDRLTVEEVAELVALSAAHAAAKSAGDFPIADSLRSDLMQWGAWPPEYGWHPVAESPAHREQRLTARLDNAA